ncbi:MAG: hypothetical protein HY662_04525 [Chloroflexi bacterium]|nr:hypothetical protein [Chloroflexota bacterium]
MNRFTLGFIIAILVLIAVTVGLVLTTDKPTTTLPENTPEGTVQRYLTAIQEQDYPKAYSYLTFERTPKDTRPTTYDEWVRSLPVPYQSSQPAWRATLGKITTSDNQSTVEILIDIFRPGGPFENPVRTQTVPFQLVKTGDSWLIISPPYLYWIY